MFMKAASTLPNFLAAGMLWLQTPSRLSLAARLLRRILLGFGREEGDAGAGTLSGGLKGLAKPCSSFLQRRPTSIKMAARVSLAVSAQHGDGENILKTPGIFFEQRCFTRVRAGVQRIVGAASTVRDPQL
ncbi:hypothetical protein AK812_SmicGene10548 [Symbiodinium microadriaticum]|uniref:Uncharacterized protein n=1 Tax=Symbiodinium microadriaticum TaxID=2951 RepID=A0A1Q9EFL0_SYMMI|nr:hypothetical protein AK812_SmicGene10548 [Symbiodinium microadriaticum]